MRRYKILITIVLAMVILTGCGNEKINESATTSVMNETQAADKSEREAENDSKEEAKDNYEAKTTFNSEAQEFLDSLTPNELAQGIARLVNTYYIDDVNEQVVCSVINTSDAIGNELLKTYPQFEGLEYIIVFGDNGLTEQVFVYRPDHDKSEVGCHGEYQDIGELGVTDWDELSDLCSNGIPEISYEPQTKEFSIEDFTDDYDKAVMPKVVLTGKDNAVESFSMYCVDRTPDINASMVGYIGSAYEIQAKGSVDKIVLTFTYVPDLLFYDNLSEDIFLPTIYYYDEKKHDLIEIDNQSREGNNVTSELDSFGVYILANKIELDDLWN